jgi:hypothetical protein
MKKTAIATLMTCAFIASGCSLKSSEDIRKDAIAPFELLKESQAKTLSELNEMSTAGGQPALVNLSGAGLKKDGHLNSQRYSISSLGGQRCESEDIQPVKESQFAKLSTANEDKASTQTFDKTFVNIGCGKNIDKALTTGLADKTITEMKKLVTNKNTWLITASKIFICGNIDLSKMNLVIFNADEVYLSNAVMVTGNKSTVLLSLSANKLMLDGESSFSSLLTDEVMPSLLAPLTKISLSVAQETQGNGFLSITAKGANCINAEKE